MITLKLVADPVGEFFIATVDHHASPSAALAVFADLDAYQGIGPHPIDLLARQGKRIEVIIRMGVVETHDVGLAVLRACQMADTIGRQQPRAFEIG
ncbi:MAG: hypothetical protein BGO93_11390 [Mesorhizobium sp. 65-26]|nr:MAG: hypothetical protein BGO93_11390 [Mesorhizobium sp. 65-26]